MPVSRQLGTRLVEHGAILHARRTGTLAAAAKQAVVEMTDAVGHAVRATYFYTAMADLAMLTGDERYQSAAFRWQPHLKETA